MNFIVEIARGYVSIFHSRSITTAQIKKMYVAYMIHLFRATEQFNKYLRFEGVSIFPLQNAQSIYYNCQGVKMSKMYYVVVRIRVKAQMANENKR